MSQHKQYLLSATLFTFDPTLPVSLSHDYLMLLRVTLGSLPERAKSDRQKSHAKF